MDQRPLAGWEVFPPPCKRHHWAGWATKLGYSLKVLISPQGMLVNRAFKAHLVSQVLWVPKVSQVPRRYPSLPQPGWISEIQALGSQMVLTHGPRPVWGRRAHRGSPHKEIPGHQDRGCIFGSVVDLGVTFPSLFDGPVMWPLSRGMDLETRSQTISLLARAEMQTFEGNMSGQARQMGPSHSVTPIWPTLLPAPAPTPAQMFDREGAKGLLIPAATASCLRRTLHWDHSWTHWLWGPGVHTQPSPGGACPTPSTCHSPWGQCPWPVPDPSDHRCRVVLLRF